MDPQVLSPWDQAFLALCVTNDIVPRKTMDHIRADGVIHLDQAPTETQALLKQLEYVKERTYDIEYAELKALNFIPLNTDAPPGAETITYRQWDIVGMAEVVANYADDLPAADTFVTEFPTQVFTIGASYLWTVQDLARAAMGEINLTERKPMAARHMIDRRIDDILAFGIPEAGTEGFVNNSNVPVVAFTNGGWLSGATSTEILEDLFQLEQAVITNTLDVREPDTMILPSEYFGAVATTPLFPGQSDSTIRTFFLNNAQSVTTLAKWSILVDVGGAPRAVCYQLSDDVLEGEVPLLLDELPPQPKNLAFVVPMWARIATTVWYRPLAAAYGEGL